MKTTEKLKIVLSLLLVAMLGVVAFGGLVAAEGEPEPVGEPFLQFQTILEMDENLTIPDGGFTFKLFFSTAQYSENGADWTNKANSPVLDQITEVFKESDTKTIDEGLKKFVKLSPNLFADKSWPAPGLYRYVLKEMGDTNTLPPGASMFYCPRTFWLEVDVQNISGVNTIAKFIVRDATDESDVKKIEAVYPQESNMFFFKNTYSMQAGGGTANEPSLTISKKVVNGTGTDNQYADLTKYFTFTIETWKAATEGDTHNYRAYLLENGEFTSFADDNGTHLLPSTDADGHQYLSISASHHRLTINLKHNQSLAFTNMGVGAKYEAKDTPTGNYTGSIEIKENGADLQSVNGQQGVVVSTGKRTIGKSTNSAAFTNTYTTSITPTGITTNDLPFIVLIGLAVAGLAVFVVAKSRKRVRSRN